MAKRRSKGDGGLHWNDKRQRWIATASLGYDGRGKRIIKRGSGKNKTEAKDKLKEILRDHDDGLPTESSTYTVANAIQSWLAYGLHGRDKATLDNYRYLIDRHILPRLGKRKLRELSADDVDKFLLDRASHVSTRTLRLMHSVLSRTIRHAQARDKVKRNVVLLCDIPQGREGRPSKALTLTQVEDVLTASEDSPLHAYIVLSLLIGARPEELRPLTWDHVDLDGNPKTGTPPSIAVWHSVRAGGETKTEKSRRTLALPHRCVVALRLQRLRQKAAGQWSPTGLVFPTAKGTQQNSHNVRRDFRRVIARAGLPARDWTPREMRHSFVSVLSDSGVPVEDIARLVGHSGTRVTELVYRKQIRPVLEDGATAMDSIFPSRTRKA